MSNYVTISTIGSKVNVACDYSRLKEATGEVIESLEMKMNRVLPDKPDLIVLVEHCDVPGSCYSERKLFSEYITAAATRFLTLFQTWPKRTGVISLFPQYRLPATVHM